MKLGIIGMAIPLGPVSHLQVQNLESSGEDVRTKKTTKNTTRKNRYNPFFMQTCHEPLESLALSKMAGDEVYLCYNFAFPHIFNQLQKHR